MRLLSREDLKNLKGIDYSYPHLWRLIRAGRFPKQIKIGGRNLWAEHEIDRLIKSLIAKRNKKSLIAKRNKENARLEGGAAP